MSSEFSTERKWLIKGHKVAGPDAAVPFSVVFPWATTVTITAGNNTDVEAYRVGDDQETDVADTVFPTGSHAVSGNRLTLRDFAGSAATPGEVYVVKISPTVDGIKDDFWFKVAVPRAATGTVHG